MKFSTMAKAGLAVLQGRCFGVSHPLFVTLATNNACQSHCKYCKIPTRRQPEMSREEIFRLIDEICACGVQRLGLWGGEPLLHPHIIDIVKYAHESGLYVTLDTNGYLLPQKTEIFRYLDHLIISLDGPEAAHDANREPGSWKKTMAAIECVPAGYPLWTITVLTKNNIDCTDWIIEEAKKRHFIPTFQVLHHSEHFGINQELRPDAEAYRRCLSHLAEARRQGAPIGTSLSCFEHLIDWKDYQKNVSAEAGKGWKHCWGGKFFVNVDVNGDVYPCSLVIGEKPAPNFLKLGFAEAYRQLEPVTCQSCLATCFSEYNLLFSLGPRTILQWVMAMGHKK